MKQPAILALTFLSESCTTALAPFSSPPEVDPPPPLHLILADIDSFLALIYNLATKLSLALKPPTPAYSASIPILQELAQHASALAHGTHLLRADVHGAALLKDVKSRLTEIIEALRALAQTFLNNAARGPQLAGSPPSDQEYLLRTSTLHELISNARGPSGLPKDNRTAVHNAWKSDTDSLDDNLQEIARLISDAENPQDDSPDDLDDGWNEFGLGNAGTRLDKDELARAKNVHSILRLTTLLHKRISLDLLPYPSSVPVSVFDSLLTQSNDLLSTSDDLVAALYTPQELPYVREQILQLAHITTSIQSQINLLLPDPLSDHLQALTLNTPSTTKKRADKKWFDTCVDQIIRLCTTVSESASQPENHTST